jgi:NAD(P)-dependent dehydrogenase (short-subunit alcohol dehydrogenase family)
MLRHVVAIVSGGSSGLGAATTSSIIRHGGRVIVADLPSSHDNYLRLASIVCAEAARLRHHQPPVEHDDSSTFLSNAIISFSPVDVRSEQDIINALDQAEEVFGEPGRH